MKVSGSLMAFEKGKDVQRLNFVVIGGNEYTAAKP